MHHVHPMCYTVLFDGRRNLHYLDLPFFHALALAVLS